MAEDQMSLAEFGKKVKAKHPEYARFGDEEIANKVIAKYPEYKSRILPAKTGIVDKIDSALAPSDESGTGLVGRLKSMAKGAAAGIVQPFLHPVETAESLGSQMVAFGTPYGGSTFSPTGDRALDEANTKAHTAAIESQMQAGVEAAKHPAYSAAQFIAPAVVAHGVREVASAVKTPEAVKSYVRNVAQQTFGAGEKFQNEIVDKYANEAEGVRDSNAKTAAKNAESTATRDTEFEKKSAANKAKVSDHARSVRELKRKARVAQEKLDQEHLESTQNALKKNADNASEHKAAVEQTQQEREGAENVAQMHADAAADVKAKTDAYFAKEDAVGAKVKSDTDKIWKPFHDAAKQNVNTDELRGELEQLTAKNPDIARELKNITPKPDEIDEENSQNSEYLKARKDLMDEMGLKGTYFSQPDEVRARIDKQLDDNGFEPEPIDFNLEQGKPIPLEDLHRAASIIGQRIGNGAYQGVVEGEMKQLYKSLAKARYKGAQELGVAGDLQKGIEATRNYKEAFGKERRQQRTVDLERKREANPDEVADRQEQKRLDAVAKHDPSLVTDYQGVKAARAKLNSLPEPDALRKGLKQAPDRKPDVEPPDRPPAIPVPEIPPTPPPSETPGLPDVQPLKPDAEAPNLNAEIREQVRLNAKRYLALAPGLVRLGLGALAIKAGVGEHSLGTFATDLLAGQSGMFILEKALRSDAVLDFISKEPDPDTMKRINALPPQDALKLREALTHMAMEDAKQGIKPNISPTFSRFLGPSNVAIIAAASTPKTAGDAKKRVANARK